MMSSPFEFFVYCLAIWRLTSMLYREDGPWDIFAHIRHLAGVRFDKYSQPYATFMLGSALMCFWCTSLYPSIIVTIAFWIWGDKILWFLAPFALSTIAIVLDEILLKLAKVHA